jgi:hypothetical protein
MDMCLPRTNSIKDLATLVRAEAASTAATTTTEPTTTTTTTTEPTTTETTTTDPNTSTTDETKPEEKKVIATVTAGKDNRIVPRGYDTTEVCTTSEECNALNRCATVTINSRDVSTNHCLPKKYCAGYKPGYAAYVHPGTSFKYSMTGPCLEFAK